MITEKNSDLSKVKLNWGRPAFTAYDGLGTLDSLHQASGAIVSVAGYFDDNFTSIGSGVMIGPGMVLTASHVFDEFPRNGSGPVILTFLPGNKARAWLPTETVTCSGASKYQPWNPECKIVSDLTILSCDLHSEAYLEYPQSLVPLELCLPLPGTRLWAVGYRHGDFEEDTALLTPFVTSGLVTNVFPHGRGERMPSSCIEIEMESLGGMSGGPVFNEDGRLIGIVSSSFDGGPTYATLIWDAMRLPVEGLPRELWGEGYSGILEGIDLGLVRVKGKFKAEQGRNIKITLSDEEVAYLEQGE
ncbi:serine protease [Halomonas sp. QHL1]|uniref:S1 family peptidase n=1 Tax=Halomonas sp. QHL1 TaxID=1123773 RepID=UPI00111476D6|nr:serine protease [Halomonas sp. QHL1]